MIRVLAWCVDRIGEPKSPTLRQSVRWEEELGGFDLQQLMELRNAADYLMIDDLNEVCCNCFSKSIAGKTAEQLRELLHLPKPFAYEEKEEINDELQCEVFA